MKAEDTVISSEEATWAYNNARKIYEDELAENGDETYHQTEADNAGINGHSLVQAEISFKAGIKEVVEWIEKKQIARYDQSVVINDSNWYRWFSLTEWQAKLKEWGIDESNIAI